MYIYIYIYIYQRYIYIYQRYSQRNSRNNQRKCDRAKWLSESWYSKETCFSNVKRICTNKKQLKKFTKNKVLRTKLKNAKETLCVTMNKPGKVVDNKSCTMCTCRFGKSEINILGRIN